MFSDDLAIGKRGENAVAAALLKRGHKVEDLTNIVEYQLKDIDFRLTDKAGITITLEVKNDLKSNRTGNVFVETYNRNNVKRGGDGWICYCDADYLCFV
jgi:predicted AAA+ superfamily ATPase